MQAAGDDDESVVAAALANRVSSAGTGLVTNDLSFCLLTKSRYVNYDLHGGRSVRHTNQIVRIKKTRILLRSTRAEAFRTIHYLIPAGSENVRMVRKLQNCMQNQKLKELKNYQFKSRFVAIVEERLKVIRFS